MKAAALKKKVRAASKNKGVSWSKVREGSQHEIWACGTQQVSIPRHREINEHTAQAILKELETMLGEEWWR